MKITLINLSFLLIIISSCNVGGTWIDENIDSDIKTEIEKLNYQLIDGFFESDQDKILAICSEELKQKAGNNLNSIIEQVKKSFIKEDFKILNEFYLKNTSLNSLTQVMTGLTGEHDYTINFKALNSEMFVSVGYFDSKLAQTSFTVIYGKYDGEWKVNIFQIGTLRIMEKDAIDWFKTAKEHYKMGYFVDAANDLALIHQILKPADKFWAYQKENEILEFSDKVMNEINGKYTFPMTVDNIMTKPEIFRIFPFGMNEGYFPMIQYTTIVDMDDSLKLAEECDEIHSLIGNLYPGLDKDKKMLFYRAFEMLPDGETPIKSYGFVREINE